MPPTTRPCATCSTAAPGPSSSDAAPGRWPWWLRSATSAAGRRGCSVSSRSAWPSGAWGFPGDGPRTGSPAPTRPMREKKARDRLIRLAQSHPDWVLGFEVETWWSRLAQPALHAWAGAQPLRLLERAAPRDDPDPKALCCYGLFRSDTGRMLLRFVEGRPVRQVTEEFLAWVCQELAREGKQALPLARDTPSWHIRQQRR